jgi:hypothetical protein
MTNNPKETILSGPVLEALVHNLIRWTMDMLSQEVVVIARSEVSKDLLPTITLDPDLITQGYDIIKPYIDLSIEDPAFLRVYNFVDSKFLDQSTADIVEALTTVHNDTEIGHA